MLRIESSQAGSIEIRLFDVSGREVLSAQFYDFATGEQLIELELPDATPGVYMLRIEHVLGGHETILLPRY